ncbi:hypothetical protein BH09BAC6_BH09BAC6_27360 [soil metagenome]
MPQEPIFMSELITLRAATRNDLPTRLQFEQGVINTERPFDPTLKSDHTNYYDIKSMITAEHIQLLVAVQGNEIIGSGYARIEEAKPYLRHTQYAYLGFMYVVPQHRGRGVNKLIIEALQQWSRDRGITETRLEVYNLNEPAIKAYEKVGFTKYMVTMRMGLE